MAERLKLESRELLPRLHRAAMGERSEETSEAVDFALRLVRELAPGPGNPGNLRRALAALRAIAHRPAFEARTIAHEWARVRDLVDDVFRMLDGEPARCAPTDAEVESVDAELSLADPFRLLPADRIRAILAERGLALVRIGKAP